MYDWNENSDGRIMGKALYEVKNKSSNGSFLIYSIYIHIEGIKHKPDTLTHKLYGKAKL